MAFCTNCGTNVGTSIRFCANCGTPQAAGSPANAPLLEFGEQARPQQQQPVSYGAAPVVQASSTNKQFILILCIAQIVAPLILVLSRAIEYISFESIKGFYIPYLIGAAFGFSPFVALAFIPKFQNDVRMKFVAAITAAVHGSQVVLFLDFGVRGTSQISKILIYISLIASLTGVVLALLLVTELKINKSLLAPKPDRWRVVPGFLAVLFLIIDRTDFPELFSSRVFNARSVVLTFVFFPIVVGACLLQEKYRQGAAAGLAVVTISSIVWQMASKILNSISDVSFISLPSVLALVCCLAVIAPNSMFQQKQTSVPR
jgi:hypothetical protein